ncbi:MAG: hypothetical protein H6Q51_1341 [Deltaproteobacteria bacterium]|nr:hypothetical protein [Deltaproteobacteria bacterium]
MVCGAKRIRSLYLPWMRGMSPKLSTTTPPKGVASLSTINAAITPEPSARREGRPYPPSQQVVGA